MFCNSRPGRLEFLGLSLLVPYLVLARYVSHSLRLLQAEVVRSFFLLPAIAVWVSNADKGSRAGATLGLRTRTGLRENIIEKL